MATIKLTRGQTAVLDDIDAALVSGRSWQASPRRDGKGWYAVARGGVRMHRLLTGALPGEIVDHIDGDGLNNRRGNLRVGTQSQNCVNRKTTPGPFMRGARLKKGRWHAYIKYRGRHRSLGGFDSEAEAHQAYLAEAKKLHGDWMPAEMSSPAEPTSGEGEK